MSYKFLSLLTESETEDQERLKVNGEARNRCRICIQNLLANKSARKTLTNDSLCRAATNGRI